ncbi:MAG: PTS sugar transporter subunit IIB [Endomicrobium sp.]|jgi:PTS system mannose-specific IIB component|nr:PTS sugar transporter subunit IIB [Endomicrobium sp.]
MTIELVRIDDRLVHGQIVQGWLKVIDINKIVVVSDEVANDRMQQMLLTMAVPSNVELEIETVEDVSVNALYGKYDRTKTMFLFSNPSDVLDMIENGVGIKSVNVGGMHFSDGKKQLLCNLSVDNKDVEALEKIHHKGIEIEGRILPDDDRIDVFRIIEKECALNNR